MPKSEFELISTLSFLLANALDNVAMGREVFSPEDERDAYDIVRDASQWVSDHSSKESIAI